MQTDNAATGAVVRAAASVRTQTIAGAAMAAMLGVFLIWGVGFSQAEAFHNAAHDMRHSNAFPCH